MYLDKFNITDITVLSRKRLFNNKIKFFLCLIVTSVNEFKIQIFNRNYTLSTFISYQQI